MAERIKLEIPRKATKTYELTFKKDGIAVDITDWTIYFYCKEKLEDSDANAKISKKITSHSDATNGITLIELTSSDTDLLGSYYYSCDYKTDDGDEGVLFSGRINFIATVINNRD